MKRFLVFEFVDHYPAGGMTDCNESFDTLDEAMAYAVDFERPWWKTEGYNGRRYYIQIFDCVEMKVVFEESFK